MVHLRPFLCLILFCWSLNSLSGASGLPMFKRVIKRKRQSQQQSNFPGPFRNGFTVTGGQEDYDENTVESQSVVPRRRVVPTTMSAPTAAATRRATRPLTTTPTSHTVARQRLSASSSSSRADHKLLYDPCGPPQSIEFHQQRRLDIGRYPTFHGVTKPNCGSTGTDKHSPRIITFPTDPPTTHPATTIKPTSTLGTTGTSRPPAFALAPSTDLDEDQLSANPSFHPKGRSYELFRKYEWKQKTSKPVVFVVNHPLEPVETTNHPSTTSTASPKRSFNPSKNEESPPSEWAINTGRASIG